MNRITKENINRDFIRMLGISYDEFEILDFDEQQKLISEYHKKHPNKDKKTLVMIGGGDESLFMRVHKGEKIWTPDGCFVAGETLEENQKRWKQTLDEFDGKQKFNKKMDRKSSKTQKLDFKTWLYLYITHAEKVIHPPVVEDDNKRTMYVKNSKNNEVFVFNDYEEYKNYYLMYLNSIEDEVIDLAVYTRGSKGQIVALKGLCEHIIVRKKMNEFYSSITQEQIDEIHLKGKLTPLEAVQMWESFDLCIEGSKSIFSKSRCQYFEQNCHECLMESASHKLEHEPIELILTNSIKEEPGSILKKTKK